MRDIVCWEDKLAEFADMLEGRGQWWLLGGGITTYPKRDANKQELHAIHEELERRGIAERMPASTEDVVIWRPTFMHRPDDRARSKVMGGLLVTRVT